MAAQADPLETREPPQLLDLVNEAAEQPLVLIVDDGRDLCANLFDLIRERGYRVAVAHDARARRPCGSGRSSSASC
ncbi:MAG: hypothetical protein U0835_15245 [Isosphaeraceae bacterium]